VAASKGGDLDALRGFVAAGQAAQAAVDKLAGVQISVRLTRAELEDLHLALCHRIVELRNDPDTFELELGVPSNPSMPLLARLNAISIKISKAKL